MPDLDSEPYWHGLREHQLRILRCKDCRLWIHYPLASCPRCHSFQLEVEAVSGEGTVYSYSIIEREFVSGVKPPYVAILVELDEQPGLRVLSNLINCPTKLARIGLRVRAVYRDITNTATLVYFEPSPQPSEQQK